MGKETLLFTYYIGENPTISSPSKIKDGNEFDIILRTLPVAFFPMIT
jgi:hypothetical protein